MSKIKDGAAIRRERITMLLDIITRNPEVLENKVKGLFMLRTGLTIRTITEMIEDLIMAEILKREGDKLSTNV